MAKKEYFPPFIDPKTGRRYENYRAIVPGTGKPIDELTVEEFLTAMVALKIEFKNETKDRAKREAHQEALHNYFYQVGWPEGWIYCHNEHYVRATGFNMLVGTALRLKAELGK